jgi:hypothetical protein
MNTFLQGIMASVVNSGILLCIVTSLIIATVTFIAQGSDWENGAVIASFLNNARGGRDAMRLVSILKKNNIDAVITKSDPSVIGVRPDVELAARKVAATAIRREKLHVKLLHE